MRIQTVNDSVTAIDFKLLFTSTERVQARDLAKTDAIVADMFMLLDDPRTQSVSLVMPQIVSMLDYLVAQGILTAERKQQILCADAPDSDTSFIPVFVLPPE
jgi:hypothetical protein